MRPLLSLQEITPLINTDTSESNTLTPSKVTSNAGCHKKTQTIVFDDIDGLEDKCYFSNI